MQKRSLLTVVALLTLCLTVLACSETHAETIEVKPATLEKIEGIDQPRVILTAKAAERLDIQTAEVRDNTASSSASGPKTVIPYSSVMYDEHGNNFTYITVEPLVFSRSDIVVDYIDGESAYLTDGPAVGTAVVIVGAAEIYGVETGIGK